ncbi:hypothetical protein Tco_1149588 [Tanacetum coccineum]
MRLAYALFADARFAEKIAYFETRSSFNFWFITGDEDTVAFMRMCLQPWRIEYILILARTRNSEPNSKPAFYMFYEVGGSGRDKDTVAFITRILAKQHECVLAAMAGRLHSNLGPHSQL